MPDEPIERETEGESSQSKPFRYLSMRLAHFWRFSAGLIEYHRGRADSKTKGVTVGDVVTVHEDNVEGKMGDSSSRRSYRVE